MIIKGPCLEDRWPRDDRLSEHLSRDDKLIRNDRLF